MRTMLEEGIEEREEKNLLMEILMHEWKKEEIHIFRDVMVRKQGNIMTQN